MSRVYAVVDWYEGVSQAMSMAMQERPSSASSPLPSAGNKLKGCSPIQKYEMLEKLGEGTFGSVPCFDVTDDSEVWKARLPATKELFALKKILMHNEKEGVSISLIFN